MQANKIPQDDAARAAAIVNGSTVVGVADVEVEPGWLATHDALTDGPDA